MASPANPSNPVSGAGTTSTQGAGEMPGTHETYSGAEAQGEGEHLTDRAKRKAGELMEQAGDSAEAMRERARSAVDQQKDAAAGRIEGVAQALRSASDDLEHRGQPMVAEYSRQIAEGLESMANWVSRRNIDDFVGGVEDFARQRPVAFMGGAMVAGFALARFMKSSSARRDQAGRGDHRGGYRATSGSYGQDRSRRTEYGGTYAGSSGSYGQDRPERREYGGGSTGTSGSYGQERPERREYGGGSTGTSGSYGQDMPRRTEYGGASTQSSGTPGQGTSTPPASAGTRPTESPGRSTEGGI